MNDKRIECGIGIDCGKVLVTKVGMYGVEENNQKENETDCVWVGKVTNYSSKYSDLAEGGQIFISENVYNSISEELKADNIWTPTIKSKSNKYFKGYSTNDFYLDIVNELGKPIKPENTLSFSENDIDIQNIYDNALTKTKELTKMEEQLKNRELEIKKEEEKIKLDISHYETKIKELYYKVGGYLEYGFCKSEYTEKMGIEFWKKCIEIIYELGEKLNYSKNKITRDFDCQLIYIYNYFGIYDEAYDVMIVMAQENGHWVNIQKNTILWAKQNYIVFKLKDAINERIENHAENTNVEKYKENLDEIEKICNGG